MKKTTVDARQFMVSEHMLPFIFNGECEGIENHEIIHFNDYVEYLIECAEQEHEKRKLHFHFNFIEDSHNFVRCEVSRKLSGCYKVELIIYLV